MEITAALKEREKFMKEQFEIRQKINLERERAYDNNPFNYKIKHRTPAKKMFMSTPEQEEEDLKNDV